MCAFASPSYSPDGNQAYFLADFAATTQMLLRHEVSSGMTSVVTTALRYWVVYAGRYLGNLVVQQRRVTLSGSYYTYYWMFSPQGDEIDLVARNESELNAFFANLDRQR